MDSDSSVVKQWPADSDNELFGYASWSFLLHSIFGGVRCQCRHRWQLRSPRMGPNLVACLPLSCPFPGRNRFLILECGRVCSEGLLRKSLLGSARCLKLIVLVQSTDRLRTVFSVTSLLDLVICVPIIALSNVEGGIFVYVPYYLRMLALVFCVSDVIRMRRSWSIVMFDSATERLVVLASYMAALLYIAICTFHYSEFYFGQSTEDLTLMQCFYFIIITVVSNLSRFCLACCLMLILEHCGIRRDHTDNGSWPMGCYFHNFYRHQVNMAYWFEENPKADENLAFSPASSAPLSKLFNWQALVEAPLNDGKQDLMSSFAVDLFAHLS